jgi:hypothetical protein
LTVTTIQIESPDATVPAARDAGLLTPQALDRLLTAALERKRAADPLLSIADRVAAAGIPPMSMDVSSNQPIAMPLLTPTLSPEYRSEGDWGGVDAEPCR